MKYERFEDLPVWNAAVELAVRVYTLTKDRTFAGPGDLSSQVRRAALSVSNNIAEGFERGTTAELLQFLYIARGSAGEVRSMLHVMEKLIASREIAGCAKSESSPTPISNREADKSDAGSEISNLKSQITRPTPEDRNEPAHRKPESAKAMPEFAHLRSEIAQLKSLAESCSRQIRAWAASLQDSDIKGQRHLTQSTREAHDAKRRAEAFWNHVDEVVQNRFRTAEDPPE